ncbi:MAG: hypothetical protein JXQ73_24505 [Phycisphaerae bacterium]|nr:hypothetical protein [Phycisphaerae bacterium]
MAIHHECSCGAHITLPTLSAGRRARCKSCGLVFRVPRPQWQIEAAVACAPAIEEIDCLRPEVNFTRNGTVIPPPLVGSRAVPRKTLAARAVADRPSFWEDAAKSFLFFASSNNLAILVMICLVQLVLLGLSSLPLVGLFTWLIWPTFGMWLFAFYFHVVVETAQGDDELSALGMSDIWEDMFWPSIRFVGCLLIALAPGIAVGMITSSKAEGVAWDLVMPAVAFGMLFWPVLVLGAAIGRTLPIRALPILVRTVAATPGPYLAVCVLVGVAGFVATQTTTSMMALVTRIFGQSAPLGVVMAAYAIGTVVETYTCIVVMRQIGLYYRHYKERFPWGAE